MSLSEIEQPLVAGTGGGVVAVEVAVQYEQVDPSRWSAGDHATYCCVSTPASLRSSMTAVLRPSLRTCGGSPADSSSLKTSVFLLRIRGRVREEVIPFSGPELVTSLRIRRSSAS